MRELRLPDLNRLKSVKKRFKNLPPQQSANDTSNWDNRDLTTFKFLVDDKERTQYYLNLLHDMDSKRRKRILDMVKELQTKYTPEELEQMSEKRNRTQKPSK